MNSTSESVQHVIPIAPYERFSYNSQSDSSFHTAIESLDGNDDMSVAGDSDDATLVEGDDFIFQLDNESPLIDLTEVFDELNATPRGKYGR